MKGESCRFDTSHDDGGEQPWANLRVGQHIKDAPLDLI